MIRRLRRNGTSVLKAKVALADLKDEKTIAEVAQKFDVLPNQITRWKVRPSEFRRDNRTSPLDSTTRFSESGCASRTSPRWGVPRSLGAAPTGVTPSIVATEEGLR